MQFDKSKTIYFLGIGGIGMSALAMYFLTKGYKVAGYDRSESAITQNLENNGAAIHYNENPALIPAGTGIVVYTPAVSAENAEFRYLAERNIPMVKRAGVLGMLSAEYKTIACAGTHGKTTTSTLTAHLLNSSKVGCSAFLGGISNNYHTNLLLSQTSPYMVVEADEFDRSFLQLTPAVAIITSIDADHLDIYGSAEEVEKAFSDFSEKIIRGGTLIIKKGIRSKLRIPEQVKCFSYSAVEAADFCISNLHLSGGLYNFSLTHPGGEIAGLCLGVPGLYNVENAVAASAAALLCGVGEAELREGLRTFSGVQRRFQVRVNTGDIVYIDDYAHHPAEIKACIASARDLFAGRKITVVFQPHLYSRTRDFADAFGESLSLADEVILLPVYPAREKPIPGVNSEMLLSRISIPHKSLVQKSDLPAFFENRETEVIITMGAGDIDGLTGTLEQYFTNTTRN